MNLEKLELLNTSQVDLMLTGFRRPMLLYWNLMLVTSYMEGLSVLL